jgi:hypothetical protein
MPNIPDTVAHTTTTNTNLLTRMGGHHLTKAV